MEPKKHRFYRKHWQNVANIYSKDEPYRAVGSTTEENYLEIGRKMLEGCRMCGFTETDTLLDFGCGNGRLALPMGDAIKGQYYGVDISPRMIEGARKKIHRRNFTFLVNHGPRLNFPTGYFDFICAFSVITHLDIDYTRELFREWKRLLKPTGNLVVSFIANDHEPSYAGTVEKVEHNPEFLKQFSSNIGFHVVGIRDAGVSQLLLHLTHSNNGVVSSHAA